MTTPIRFRERIFPSGLWVGGLPLAVTVLAGSAAIVLEGWPRIACAILACVALFAALRTGWRAISKDADRLR